MPHITGLDVLIAAVLAVLCVIGVAVYFRLTSDTSDPFGPEDDPDSLPSLGRMPVEVAHEPRPLDAWKPLPPWHDELNGPPWSSPAAPPAIPPAPAPPPLPDADDIDALVRIATDTPSNIPFEVWQLDEFVEAYNNAQTRGA